MVAADGHELGIHRRGIGGAAGRGHPESLTGLGIVEDGATIFQVKIREGANWSDGNPFTAADVVSTFSLQRLMSNVVWKYLESVEAVDDYTVNFTMSAPSTVVQRYVLRMSTQSNAVYGEWSTQIDELIAAGKTSEDPEWRQLIDQFNQFRPEQIVASGPITIDMETIGDSNLTFIRNDAAWNADQFQFDKIVDYNGSGDAIISVIVAGDVDYGTQAFTPPVEKEMTQTGFRFVRPPIYSGPAIIFNFGKFPQLLDEKVRQAMACVIDREQNGFISLGVSGVPVMYMAGLSDQILPTWVTEEQLAAFDTYDLDLDRAAQLLTEAGWTKDGDTWKMADGEEASFELLWPAEYPDWSAAGQDATDQLNNFGIKIEPRAVTQSQQPIDVDKGAFELAIRGWGNSSNPHPHFSYSTAFFTHNTLAINNGGKGTQFPLVQETESSGEVDLEQLTIDSAQGLDESAQQEHVAVIASVYNELLPSLPLWERYGNNSVLENERVGEWPPDENPVYRNSPYADGIVTIFMLTGQIAAVQQ